MMEITLARLAVLLSSTSAIGCFAYALFYGFNKKYNESYFFCFITIIDILFLLLIK